VEQDIVLKVEFGSPYAALRNLVAIGALTRALVGEDASDAQVDAATEVAMAQLELFRVRAVRTELFGKINITSGDIKDLERLAALDRYENIAQTRRRRASPKLEQDD
jgi:hypothetical protein